MRPSAAADIATIGRISAVPALLQVIREMTGLRFAAVARVTEDSWTACAVLDQLDFGLQVGGELDVVTTLCHEIRSAHQSVVIDKASADPLYCNHHTPRLYQFESYIYASGDKLLGHILSSTRRASQLVDDVLDFARGRLGNGIPVNLAPCSDLAPTLNHVIEEIQNVHPQRRIRASIGDLQGLRVDRERVGQLLSNLLANAMVHGEPQGEVEVSAQVEHGALQLRVKNPGKIADEILPQLFLPYSRPTRDTPQAGLGLGLYIASQIAQSHGGQLQVTSTAQDGTAFTFSLPASPQA